MPSDPIDSFKTHSNYIHAFQLLVHDLDLLNRQDLYARLRNRILRANMLPAPSGLRIDLSQVRSILHAAWGIDTLLSMTHRYINEEELLRLSNSWSAIQVYYIFYHCTQALHVAKGHPRPENHPTTQNVFYDYWGSRSFHLPPWSLAFGVDGPKNTPPGFLPDVNVHPWTTCLGDNVWNLAFKALMTTRRDCLEIKYRDRRLEKKRERKQAWRRQEEARIRRGSRPRVEPTYALPRLTDQEKERIDRRLRPFTIMDYLYRVRIKTNYEDSALFSYGPNDTLASRHIRNAICTLASATAFLHELAIHNLVGSTAFLTWTDEWIQRNIPRDLVDGLRARRQYLT